MLYWKLKFPNIVITRNLWSEVILLLWIELYLEEGPILFIYDKRKFSGIRDTIIWNIVLEVKTYYGDLKLAACTLVMKILIIMESYRHDPGVIW